MTSQPDTRAGCPCPGCGRANAPDSNFCRHCGRPLVDPPRLLAEQILASREALEGERKQVTVLFADVQDSMDLAEQVDPEEWHHLMDRFFSILAEGVHRFDGTVTQFTGDGIMALFGAPVAREDHAQRACHAALLLRERLRDYGKELERTRSVAFAVRMGLNSGEVVVGKIGDDLRMEYTAQGHTVGLAERMQRLAEPGSVYLTARTAALASGYFEFAEVGEVRVKGVRQPVRTLALVGIGPLRTRLEVARVRGYSRFVGRAAEVASLDVALEHARAGHGEVIGS